MTAYDKAKVLRKIFVCSWLWWFYALKLLFLFFKINSRDAAVAPLLIKRIYKIKIIFNAIVSNRHFDITLVTVFTRISFWTMCAAQYLPGTASLIEELDKKLMVLLRDGRTLIGYLRSVDQFANLVLHRTIERIHVGSDYGDIPRGIFVVRGENVVC